MHREIRPFDPRTHARTAWPGWSVRLTKLAGADREVILTDVRVALVDPKGRPAREAVAHTLSHLDLEHHLTPGERFTPEQEADADWLARVQLAYGCETLGDFPLDGPPSIVL